MDDRSFHAAGLRFSCKRCSSCCRHESGFVFLSENDLSRLANEFKMDYTDFIAAWCRWVPFERGSERLSLKEKSSFDCIFWNSSERAAAPSEGATRREGCTVYHARPLQCRAFPFWDSIMCSPEAWETAGRYCPGIRSGDLHGEDEINGFLRLMEEETIIERVREYLC